MTDWPFRLVEVPTLDSIAGDCRHNLSASSDERGRTRRTGCAQSIASLDVTATTAFITLRGFEGTWKASPAGKSRHPDGTPVLRSGRAGPLVGKLAK